MTDQSKRSKPTDPGFKRQRKQRFSNLRTWKKVTNSVANLAQKDI